MQRLATSRKSIQNPKRSFWSLSPNVWTRRGVRPNAGRAVSPAPDGVCTHGFISAAIEYGLV